ncbi:NAD(P)/FAD-dependent oxidoreductase [Saccharophagus degradans]|uniref:FAD-dependent oxidoreductase n=2 Tax=Gammaproteobacteria TaxID=1236 RepID=A0AAW7X6C9_9GAMM|nr:FAD-dependent oxidoreductase [Saccharophagus degradans]MDO6423115.1 FAD-dependent oxidoreductase [Saccharophagus degradans]MDO6607361.1 FAD-dependent oxidoreductase [Saccharophagus degradans]
MNNANQQKAHLVIVGNGMATGRLLDELIKRDANAYNITVIGDEPEGSYNRIMLSPVLAGETELATIINKPAAWYAQNNIRFVAGVRANAINRQAQTVALADGSCIAYDELVIATGSRPALIPAKNQHLQNIFSFRTIEDVNSIASCAQAGRKAVVVGGGLLGLEAAYGLAQKGVQVTLVHRSKGLLNRQLDSGAGEFLQQVMASKNIQFALGTEVAAFNSGALDGSGFKSETLKSATLTNGEIIECDLAVISTGITPNKELGQEAGLACGRAIIVDDFMTSSDNRISALGECCEHKGETFGLVEPIWHQCISLAEKLCFKRNVAFVNPVVATKLKVSGVQLFSAGEHLTGDDCREIKMVDVKNKIYRKLVLRNNRIVGVVLFGDTRSGADYFELMQQAVDVSSVAALLVMGKAFYAEQLQAAQNLNQCANQADFAQADSLNTASTTVRKNANNDIAA